MAVWDYFNPEDYNENAFGIIPVGKYRVRIEEAFDQVSKSGKDMIKITLSVSGYSSKIWYYLVLDNSTPESIKQTNQRLGSFWNSFRIPQGNLSYPDWRGRVGGIKVRHSKDHNGNDRADVHYFLKRSEVDTLPAWQEVNAHQSDNQQDQPVPQQDNADFDPFYNLPETQGNEQNLQLPGLY